MPFHRCISAVVLAATAASCALAQNDVPPADARPASTNAPGRDYPRVDSDAAPTSASTRPTPRASASASAIPNYKDDKGVWTGLTKPLDPGFHYYQLVIDGFAAADPSSESFFGSSSMRSGIEIPDAGDRLLRRQGCRSNWALRTAALDH